jgi:uncharacterized protein (TIGR02453 family)
MAGGIITPELFSFLRALARNNEREWFHANKQRYVDCVRDPLCAFVEAVGPKLRGVHPDVVADSRPVGGSLFRPQRDTRFSKDKTPYKTHAALKFPCGPKDRPVPGFYLGLEPGSAFVGVGLWHPPTDVLQRVRRAIVEDAAGWKRARKVGLDEDDERLVRVPRGFDPEHPFADDLRRKSFTGRTAFSEKQACAADFPTRFVQACRRYRPLVEFLSACAGSATRG